MHELKPYFPKRIAVSIEVADPNENLPDLLAWPTLEGAENGFVAIYELVEILEKTTVPKIRAAGSDEEWHETEELNS